MKHVLDFYPAKWSKKTTPKKEREYICNLSSACGCVDEIVDWAKEDNFFVGKLIFHTLEGETFEVEV